MSARQSLPEPDISADPHDNPDVSPRPAALKGAVFLCLFAALIGGLGFVVLQMRGPSGGMAEAPAQAPLPVQVRAVEFQASVEIDEQFSGLISPQRTSQLGFSTGGRVQAVLADVGDRVQAGQKLAQLDTRGLQAELKSAQARLKAAEASHALALTTLGRQVALHQRGHVSAQIVDEARAQSDRAAADIDAALAGAQALRVQIDLAQITAPFAGTITRRMVDEGAITAPATPVLELVEAGQLEATIGLPAKLARTLEVGQNYSLLVGADKVPARLRARTGVINASQRTVAAVFDVEDADLVPAGTVARIALKQTLDEQGFWVPVSALAEADRGLWSVYVAQPSGEDWRVAPATVDLLHSAADRAYVRGALAAGDRVILDGLHRITPGQRVTPTETGDTAATKRAG